MKNSNTKNKRYNWVVMNGVTGKVMYTETKRRALFKTRKEARQFASTRPFGRVVQRSAFQQTVVVAAVDYSNYYNSPA